jgi:hypothetical protein
MYTLDQLPGGPAGLLAKAEVKFGAWVDNDGLPRRIRMDMDMSRAMAAIGLPAELTKKSTMSMTMEFFDYGSPVGVSVPPANEVLDADDPLLTQNGANGCLQAKQRQLSADIAARLQSGEQSGIGDITALMEKAAAECQGVS